MPCGFPSISLCCSVLNSSVLILIEFKSHLECLWQCSLLKMETFQAFPLWHILPGWSDLVSSLSFIPTSNKSISRYLCFPLPSSPSLCSSSFCHSLLMPREDSGCHSPHGFLCFPVLSSGGVVELVRVSCSLQDWLPGSLIGGRNSWGERRWMASMGWG